MTENQSQPASSQAQGQQATSQQQPATPQQNNQQAQQQQQGQAQQPQQQPNAQQQQPPPQQQQSAVQHAAQQQPQHQATPAQQQQQQIVQQQQQQQAAVQGQQQQQQQPTLQHQVQQQQHSAVQQVSVQQVAAQQQAAVQQVQQQQVQQQHAATVQQQQAAAAVQQQVLQSQQPQTPTITPLQGIANVQNLQNLQSVQGVQNNAATATIMPVSNGMMSLSGNVTPVFSGGQIMANPMNSAMANAMTVNQSLRNAIPQVQVIPQMHNTPFMQQFPYNQQQQFMIQNAAMQAMQANMNMNMNPQQINVANMNMAMAMQRQGLTNQAALMSPSPTTPTQQVPNITFSAIPAQVSNANATSTAGTKATQANKGQTTPGGPQAQATALIGGKPIMPTQANIGGTPVVLGVVPNQMGNQGYVAQSKGGSVAMSINQTGQTQLISTQSPIRFSQPQLVSSAGGQIISSTPIMTNQAVLQAMANLQHQGMPINNAQGIMGAQGQSPTIIQGQGLYIRAANPIQGQQGIMTATGVQTLGTIKGNQQNIVKPSVNAMPIGKTGQTVQVGKALLPMKVATARVNPTSVQKGKVAVSGAPKAASRGRPRTVNRVVGPVCLTASASTNTVASALQSKAVAALGQGQAKVAPSGKQTGAGQAGSRSDSETESSRKNGVENGAEKILEDRTEKKAKVTDTINLGEEKEEKMDTSEEEPKGQGQKGDTPAVIEKQKAIVKPHILTHVIEGFIIQEGNEPFPVQRSSLLTEFIPPKQTELDAEIEEEAEEAETSQRKPPKDPPPEFFSKCEFCGSEEQASRFKRSTRFCTMACAKRYNVAHRMAMFKPRGKPGRPPGSGRGIMKKRALLNIRKGWKPGRGGKATFSQGDKEDEETNMEEGQTDDTEPASHSGASGNDSSSSPESPTMPPKLLPQDEEMDTVVPHSSPAKWTVMEVYEFVKSMPGCSPYADEFKSQEIDGQALMLLKEDHLMTTMNMKLGPALKICAKINSMKGDSP